jgi:hypothetical protein
MSHEIACRITDFPQSAQSISGVDRFEGSCASTLRDRIRTDQAARMREISKRLLSHFIAELREINEK